MQKLRHFYFIILIFFSFCGAAQTFDAATNAKKMTFQKVIDLDRSKTEYIYSHYVYDPEYGDKRTSYYILQIGSKYSKYGDYGAFKLDSILSHLDKQNMTVNEYLRLRKYYGSKPDYIIQDNATQSISVYNKIVIDHYVYKEEKPEIKWALTNESDNICGYQCKKATASFRGRNWTAWYCENIPMDNGPWKFRGLPGLILKVEDSLGEHKFTAISIRKSDNIINRKDYDYIPTSREKFNKAMLKHVSEPWKLIEGTDLAPKSANGTEQKLPHNKLFYNPIEKE